MDTAVIALTKEGSKKAIEVAIFLAGNGQKIKLYLPQKFNRDVYSELEIQNLQLESMDIELNFFLTDKFSELIPQLWARNQVLVFIMALGIVVRKLATLIDHKAKDPAVIVMDELGKYIISVLSGHLGGANQMAHELAKGLGSTPVITTATDVQGKPAFDLLAKKYGLYIENFQELKKANGALVNGEEIEILLDEALEDFLSQEALPPEVIIKRFNFNETFDGYGELEAGGFKVLITNKTLSHELENILKGNKLLLRPKNIQLGLGCRKGIAENQLQNVIAEVLKENQLSLHSVAGLASVDVKKREEGLLKLAETLDCPLTFFSAQEIKVFQLANPDLKFNYSAFVEKQIGVGIVCEPVAVMSKKNSSLIQPKIGRRGVTIALAEANYGWWE